MPAEIAGKAVRQYKNRLLELRGTTIGAHETLSALAGSKDEAYRQAVDRGSVPAQAVTKTWRHFPNEHPRAQHVVMAGKAVGLDEAFELPDGTRMRYPHDPDAPVSQTAGCHCQADYRIDFLASLAA